ncbi:BamA/TamA family outer membrane protein [Ruegeria sp. 2205SS24-7]|uniref:autotransporter assembly complex protein TamA n=1 Tax=Ruegeria discodermiae TaxID=3064389 RepID=UPI0027418D2C|nr:BamA/TamA family outer membrane protein [Ruegeria sp. 2205SS24-7]MDP5218662.1 BamA/TamA family outer membrane protein [Ruegeria sp. 2205SS24-7]
MTGLGKWKAVKRGCMMACVMLSPSMLWALETGLSAPGASEELREKLEEGSSVLNAEARGLDTPLELLSAALADYRTLVQILYDAGYFSPVVNIRLDGQEAADIDPLNTPGAVQSVNISVKTGPSFTFGAAEIAPLARGTELPENFAPGRPASTGTIQQAATAAVQGWRDVGHPKAAIGDQKITARHTQARLDAQIDVAQGQRLTFGTLHIKGDTRVRPESIYRIAGFPTGEIYSPAQVQQVGTRLRRTGTFSSVRITEYETANPDGSLDFDATFEDMPPRRLSFGVELSSNQGLDLSLAWYHRNVFRRAARFKFEAALRNIGGDEDIDGRIGMRLDMPDRLGPDDSMFYLAQWERRNREHYDISTLLLGVGARRVFSPALFAEAYVAVSDAKADDAFGDDRPFRYLLVPFRAEWDRRDNKVNPTRGFFLDGRFTPLIGISGTETAAQLYGDGRTYFDVASNGNLVLAGRVQVGSVGGPALNKVSPEYLFFSGGAGTVRGQPYESLGIPVGDEVAGGKSFLGLSAEVRGRVTESISLVGFYDYGMVGADAIVTGDSESHSGAGIGVRYDLGGFGPLRVDLAVPVSGDTGDGLQFYIGIGQAF